MKTAFALLLVALMILPAIAVVRIRLARVRREVEAQRLTEINAQPDQGEEAPPPSS